MLIVAFVAIRVQQHQLHGSGWPKEHGSIQHDEQPGW